MKTLIAFLLLFLFAVSLFAQSGWEVVHEEPGTYFRDVAAIGEDRAIAIAFGVGLRTTDGGMTWDQLDLPSVSGTGSRLWEIQFIDPLVGFIAGGHVVGDSQRTILLRTVDGGDTWGLMPTMSAMSGQWTCITHDTERILVGGESRFGKMIASSTDKGLNWRSTFVPGSLPAFEQIDLGEKSVALAVEAARSDSYWQWSLQRTTDGGGSWNELSLSVPPGAFGPFDVITDVVHVRGSEWMLGSTLGVFRSTDNGLTWDTAADGQAEWRASFNTFDFHDASIGFAANGWFEKGQMGRTEDGGVTWRCQILPDGVEAVTALSAADEHIVYAVAANGAILKTISGGEAFDDVPASDYAIPFPRAMPNPTSGRMSIELPPDLRAGEIVLVNPVGEVVCRKALSDGTTSVTIDLDAVAPGIYLLRADGLREGKKIIVHQ